MLKNYLNTYISFAVCLLAVAGCTSFDRLTALPADNSHGPGADECGACHITQYQEWSLSAHAGAFQNPAFQAMFSDGDDDCLSCHAPLNVRGGDPVSRSFNQQEGITCISCHLSQGVMHGPHSSSALFQPHPVQENDPFYRENAICAVCHGETNDEYQAAADSGSMGSPIKRPLSRE